MPLSLLMTLALMSCGKSDFGIYEASEAACDGLLGPDENDVVDSPWDVDGDGFFDERNPDCAETYNAEDLDCDDGDVDINPGGVEYCDFVDNDCDDDVDEDGAADAERWYLDDDSDGFGDRDAYTEACEAPANYGDDDSDCDDADDRTFPGAAELCDTLDNDCDAAVDEDASDAPVWYDDRDGDGYGDELDPGIESCDQPKGKVGNRDDCNDDEPTMYPSFEEVCDGLDNDCDGAVEEDAIGNATWYADFDQDDFGNPDNAIMSCDQPENYISDDRDCDDTRSDINPLADEYCDEVDEDCDGDIDEDAIDTARWYSDDDSDDYGDDDDAGVDACEAPTGHVGERGDCDDGDDDINPDAEEICDDELDNDCDGDADEECTADYSGLYGLDDTISYQCAEFFGVYYVVLDFNQISVSHAGTTANFTAGGGSQPGSMSGTVDSAGNFSASNTYPGGCTETYTIDGTFDSESTFTGTFTAEYSGAGSACLDCTDQLWPIVVGTK